MTDVLTAYFLLLLEQMQNDARVMTTPWVYTTIIPFLLYFVYCILKWWILLAPITLPLTVLNLGSTARDAAKETKQSAALLEKWLKRN